MKLGNRHGPRFHMNLFGALCPRWPCVHSTNTSSLSSASTHSSTLLDNDDYTSSWTYVHYQANSASGADADENSNHTGSTFNDTELISLINQGGTDTQEGEFAQSGNSNEVRDALPWLNLVSSGDRHSRGDVRTLFPEACSQLCASSGNAGDTASAYGSGNPSSDARDPCEVASECQYMNVSVVPSLRRSRECIPVYAAGRSSSRSASSHGSSVGRHSVNDLFDLEPVSNTDWATGGDHPYGIPSSLLGGVLLNLDNQFRLSSNEEWHNWSEYLTSAQEPDLGAQAEEQNQTESVLRDSSAVGASQYSEEPADVNELNNSLNNENTTGDSTSTDPQRQNRTRTDNLPSFNFPQSGFLNRQFTLPTLPLSNSSSCSSRSGSGSESGSRHRQQEWYFYDPRLISEQRTERVTLDTSFRGLHNRCIMSSIIQPPAYDDIIQGDGGNVIESGGDVQTELPPPYTEHLPPAEPPPSYDQSFSHNLAFPTFNLGLPVNPLERRLAASLGASPLIMTAMATPVPEPDLLTDVNIDELLDGTVDDSNLNNRVNNGLPVAGNLNHNSASGDGVRNEVSMEDAGGDVESDEELLMESDSEEELLGERLGISNGDANNSNFSFRQNPVSFFLGRRPPLRWSRGMGPNRWAPTENWPTR